MRRSFLQLDRQLGRLKARWGDLPGSLRVLAVAVFGLVCAVAVSSATSWSNTYSMRARTSVVTVEPSCGRSLVWDLPAGRFAATSADAPPPLDEGKPPPVEPPPARLASARLTAGARARIERVGDSELAIHFEASPQFASCASADALVEVRIHASTAAALPEQTLMIRGAQRGGSDRIVYRSDNAAAEYVLPLEGRIVVGAELQHGAGWHGAAAPALLDSADIEVRSLEGATGHSVALRSERVDSGGIVDFAPCFEHGPSPVDRMRLLWDDPMLALQAGTHRAQACTRALRSPALGLVRPHKEGGMEAHAHVLAQHLGITAHQGQTRLFGVTLWQSLTHSHLVQALVVFVVVLGGAEAAIGMFYRIHGAPGESETAQPRAPTSRTPRNRSRPRRRSQE